MTSHKKAPPPPPRWTRPPSGANIISIPDWKGKAWTRIPEARDGGEGRLSGHGTLVAVDQFNEARPRGWQFAQKPNGLHCVLYERHHVFFDDLRVCERGMPWPRTAPPRRATEGVHAESWFKSRLATAGGGWAAAKLFYRTLVQIL